MCKFKLLIPSPSYTPPAHISRIFFIAVKGIFFLLPFSRAHIFPLLQYPSQLQLALECATGPTNRASAVGASQAGVQAAHRATVEPHLQFCPPPLCKCHTAASWLASCPGPRPSPWTPCLGSDKGPPGPLGAPLRPPVDPSPPKLPPESFSRRPQAPFELTGRISHLSAGILSHLLE